MNTFSENTDPETNDQNVEIKPKRSTLLLRRVGAWLLEIGLITTSALVPLTMGHLTNRGPELVSLNSISLTTSETISQILGLPGRDKNRQVTPITNLLWLIAFIAPIIMIITQLYLLANKGQTLPKRWLGIKVVNASGMPPQWVSVIKREILGRYGIPLTLAYAIWRLSGAFPIQFILWGLVSLFLLGDALFLRSNSLRRTAHDRIGGTFVMDAELAKINPNPFSLIDGNAPPVTSSAIVLYQEEIRRQTINLWLWMRQNPGLTLLIVTGSSIAAILGTFVITQIYIQTQANLRQFKQQDDEIFLALVTKLSPNSGNSKDREVAILALGAANDSRAVPLLTDLLAQETNPAFLDIIQQALVTSGVKSLPYLQRLNQALTNDLDSLRYGGNTQEKQTIALRQRATKRAISKVLKIYSGKLNTIDLTRVDLSQNPTGPAQFTLVLDNNDLSGVNLNRSDLTNASLKNTKFYSAGQDDRFGTFDDWIANISDANLTGANLTESILSNTIANGSSFFKAVLNKANFTQAQLAKANFSSARLIAANLQESILINAKFTGADLGSANFTGVNLTDGRLSQSQAQAAIFTGANLARTDWKGADLSGADFTKTNLQNADLTSANLTGATLRNANLKDANFRNADLSLVDLRGANVKGANFQGTKFLNTNKNRPNQFSQGVDNIPRFLGVNFADTKNLNPSQIAYICLQRGIHPQCPQK